MICSYCNDIIDSGEQYYEICYLIGVYLHTDCLPHKVIINPETSEHLCKFKIQLMTRPQY
jgi:hypothetical protein